MEERIPTADLRVGMYLVRYGEGTFDNPLVCCGHVVTERETVAGLLRDGVPWVVVDGSKGLSRARPRPSVENPRVAEELARYEKTVEYAARFMEDLRSATRVDPGPAVGLVGSLLETVMEGGGYLQAVAKLAAHDEYTCGHCVNVAVLSMIFGKSLGLSERALLTLGLGGLFHDVGKAKIPLDILNKPGPLDERELDVMREHTRLGYWLLSNSRGMPEFVALSALEHHERYHGAGYPKARGWERLAWPSRILGVCDVYDAVTSERVYKPGRSPMEAMGLLFTQRGREFEEGMVQRFIRCMGVYPQGSLVELSCDALAVVTQQNPRAAHRPKVRVVRQDGRPVEEPFEVDLGDKAWGWVSIVRGAAPEDHGLEPLELL